MELIFTGLMDLAESDTTEVRALRNRLQPAGIYVVLFESVRMAEAGGDDPEAKRISIRFAGTIEHFDPLAKDESDSDSRDLTGNPFNQFTTMFLDDVPTAIGLIKGMYERARFPTVGKMGGIEGVEGWLNGPEGQRVGIRVRHATRQNGDAVAYYDWLSPVELQKAGIDWDSMGRDALTASGEVIADPYVKK